MEIFLHKGKSMRIYFLLFMFYSSCITNKTSENLATKCELITFYSSTKLHQISCDIENKTTEATTYYLSENNAMNYKLVSSSEMHSENNYFNEIVLEPSSKITKYVLVISNNVIPPKELNVCTDQTCSKIKVKDPYEILRRSL